MDKDDKIIAAITKIRADNNKLWMNLLTLALDSSPKEAKKILKDINSNDKAVSKLIKELSK
jgi:hypothetical protein